MSKDLRHIGTGADVAEAIARGEKFVARCGALSRPRPGLSDRPTCSECVDAAMADHEQTVGQLIDTFKRLGDLEIVISDMRILAERGRSALTREGPAKPPGAVRAMDLVEGKNYVAEAEVSSAAVNGCAEAEDPERGPDFGLFSTPTEAIAPRVFTALRFTAAEAIPAGAVVGVDASTGYLRPVPVES